MDTKKELKNTTYAVLGVLRHGRALSGYDIRKEAETLRYFYWSPAQSHIYAELRRLEGLDYVSSEHVVQDGRPNKRLYRITADGQAAFQVWLNTRPLEPTVVKHPLLLRLFFGDVAEDGRLAKLIGTYIEDLDQSLGQLAIVEEFLADDPDKEYESLIAQWNYLRLASEKEIAVKILSQL